MDIIQIHPYPARPRRRARFRKKHAYCDSFGVRHQKPSLISYKDILFNRANVSQTILGGSRGHVRSHRFVTEDSHLCTTQQMQHAALYKKYRVDARRRFDGVHMRYVQEYGIQDRMFFAVSQQFTTLRDQIRGIRKLKTWDLSPVRMWQMSMACAMVFGMVTISMVYKNLGNSVQAKADHAHDAFERNPVAAVVGAQEEFKRLPVEDKVYSEKELLEQKERESLRIARQLRDAAQAQKRAEQARKVALEQSREQAMVSAEEKQFERKARAMVAGYPIEEMLPEILKLDREVAIYLIAMAKQESQWGKRVPVLHGGDCFNYWGYRGKRERMGTGGHTCFDSREDAVQTVGKRVHTLIYEYQRTTPERMLVWKCGRSCEGHTESGVNAWVSTVTMYRNALKS